jgi:nitrogen fixation protein FixH
MSVIRPGAGTDVAAVELQQSRDRPAGGWTMALTIVTAIALIAVGMVLVIRSIWSP